MKKGSHSSLPSATSTADKKGLERAAGARRPCNIRDMTVLWYRAVDGDKNGYGPTVVKQGDFVTLAKQFCHFGRNRRRFCLSVRA